MDTLFTFEKSGGAEEGVGKVKPTAPIVSPVVIEEDRAAKTDKLTEAWKVWKADPSLENFNLVHKYAQPTISSVMTNTGAGVSPLLRSKAKILLHGALQSYEPGHNAKLSTHIYTQLRPLQREVFSSDTLYVPERMRYAITPINKATTELTEELGREPNDDEIADRTGMSVKFINKTRGYSRPTVYESKLLTGDDGKGYLPGSQSSIADISRGIVYGSLGDVDKAIVDLKTHHLEGDKQMSVTDIAKRVGLSPGAVSQRMEKVEQRISDLETSYAK